MNFDFGEVLSHAWQITWKHKALWVIGILYGVLVALMFPLLLSPLLFPVFMQQSRMDLALISLAGFVVLFGLWMLVLYPVGVLAQTSITLGALEMEQKEERSSVTELLKRSRPFFWRVLGLMVLFALGMLLLNLVIQAVMFFVMIVTLGFGAICIMPLSLLMYPVLYGSIVWMEQSMNGIVVDNMTIREAARQGWALLRRNILPFVMIVLVLYFGLGMIMAVALIPALVPFFVLPFSFLEQEVNWIVLSIALGCVAVFVPLFAILTGWSMIFTKSTWVLTYLRLLRSPQLPLPPEATL